MEIDGTNGNTWGSGAFGVGPSKTFGSDTFGNAPTASVFGGMSGFGTNNPSSCSTSNGNGNVFGGFSSFSTSSSPAFSSSRPSFSGPAFPSSSPSFSSSSNSAFSALTPSFQSSSQFPSSNLISSSPSFTPNSFSDASSSFATPTNFELAPMTSTFFFDNSTNHTTSVFSQTSAPTSHPFSIQSSERKMTDGDDNVRGNGGKRGKRHETVCRFWVMPRGCKSEKCPFLHPADQDGTKMNVTMQPVKELEVCRYWQLATCKNNPCSYAHPPDQFGIKGTGKNSEQPEKDICSFWIKGTCKSNPCRHRHPPEHDGSKLNVIMQPVKETPVCKYWVNGTCKSSPCQFLHPPDQDGSKLNVVMQARREPEVCKYWLKGKCQSDPCLFLHPPQEEKKQPPQQMKMSKDSSDVCVFWQRGNCKNDPCQFRHPPEQNGAKVSLQKERAVCTFWLKGFCNREECAYNHVPKADLLSTRNDRSATAPTKKVVKRATLLAEKQAFATPEHPRRLPSTAQGNMSSAATNSLFSPIAMPNFMSPVSSFPATAKNNNKTTSAKSMTNEISEIGGNDYDDDVAGDWEQHYDEETRPDDQGFARWQAGEGEEYPEEQDENWQGEEMGDEGEQPQCEYCGEYHHSNDCPVIQESLTSTPALSTLTPVASATLTPTLIQPRSSSFSSSAFPAFAPSATSSAASTATTATPSTTTCSSFSSSSVFTASSFTTASQKEIETEEQSLKKRSLKLSKTKAERCEYCGGSHPSSECTQDYDNDEVANEGAEQEAEEEEEEVTSLPMTKKGKRGQKALKSAPKPKKAPVVVNVKVSSRGIITPVEMTEEQAAARRNKFGSAISAESKNNGSSSNNGSSNATCDICGDRHASSMCPVLGNCGTPVFDDGKPSIFTPEMKETPGPTLRRRDEGGGEDDFDEIGSAIVGECLGMCPEQEIIDRNGRDVSVFEQGHSRLVLDRDLAVKKYKRAAAGQKMNAKEVRPPHVLRKTLLYLCDNVLDQNVELLTIFDFISDRFRAIRQDYLCQAQNDELCLASFETMLRFHIMTLHELSTIEIGTLNVSKLTQTMTSLMRWYSEARAVGKPAVNEAEFRAYQLLFYMFDRTMFMVHLTEMPSEIRKSEQVKFATQVYLAKQECNYVRFFRLVQDATYLQACCMHKLFNEMRVGALRRMVTSYKGKNVPLRTLSSMLLFESEEEAKEFYTFYGVSCVKVKAETLVDFMSLAGVFTPKEQTFPRSLCSVITSKKPATVGEVVLPPHDVRLRNSSTTSSGNSSGGNGNAGSVGKVKKLVDASKSTMAQLNTSPSLDEARAAALARAASRAAAFAAKLVPPTPAPLEKVSPKSNNLIGPATPAITTNKRCDSLVTKATTSAKKAQEYLETTKEAVLVCERSVKLIEVQRKLEYMRQKRYWHIWYTATLRAREINFFARADEFRAKNLCKQAYATMKSVFHSIQETKADKFALRKYFQLWRYVLDQRNKQLALFTPPDPVSSFRTSFISPFEKLRIFGRSGPEGMDLSIGNGNVTSCNNISSYGSHGSTKLADSQERIEWSCLNLASIVYPSLKQRNPDFDPLFFNLAISIPSFPPSSSSSSSSSSLPSPSSLARAASHWLMKKFSHERDGLWSNEGGVQSLVVVAEGRPLEPREGRGLQAAMFLLSPELEELSSEGVLAFARRVKQTDDSRLRAFVGSLHPQSTLPLLVLYTVSNACLLSLQNEGVYEAVLDQISEVLPQFLSLPRTLAQRISDSHIVLLLDRSATPFSSLALSKGVEWLAASSPPYPKLGALSLCRMLDQHIALHRDYLREYLECVEGPGSWIDHFNLAIKDVLNVLTSYCLDAPWPPLVPPHCTPELPDQWWGVSQVQDQVSSLLLPPWPWPSRVMSPTEAWTLWQQYMISIPTSSQSGIQPSYFVDILLTTNKAVSIEDWCKCMECLFSQRLSLFRSCASTLKAVCPLSVPVSELLLAAFNVRKAFKKPSAEPVQESVVGLEAPLWVAEPLSISLEEEQDRSMGFRSRLAETEQQLSARHQQQERQQRRRRKRRQQEKIP